MPKISVDSMRWGLLTVNLLVLGGVGYASYSYFLGPRDELERQLEASNEFEVKPVAKSGTEQRQVTSILNTLLIKRPVVKPPVTKKPVEIKQKGLEGGPLASEWAVSRVFGINGADLLTLVKKTDDTASAVPTRSARGRRTPRGGRTSRRSTRSPAASLSKGPEIRLLSEGQDFKIDDKSYRCEEINTAPAALVYSLGSRRYTLTPEDAKDNGAITDTDGLLTLRAKQKDPDNPTGLPVPESTKPKAKVEVSKPQSKKPDVKKPVRPNSPRTKAEAAEVKAAAAAKDAEIKARKAEAIKNAGGGR